VILFEKFEEKANFKKVYHEGTKVNL